MGVSADRCVAIEHVSTEALKNIKSDIIANFLWKNNIVATSDLNTIENYIKNIDVVNSNDIMSPKLPQSKLYLKILDIPSYIKETNLLITIDIVERVI